VFAFPPPFYIFCSCFSPRLTAAWITLIFALPGPYIHTRTSAPFPQVFFSPRDRRPPRPRHPHVMSERCLNSGYFSTHLPLNRCYGGVLTHPRSYSAASGFLMRDCLSDAAGLHLPLQLGFSSLPLQSEGYSGSTSFFLYSGAFPSALLMVRVPPTVDNQAPPSPPSFCTSPPPIRAPHFCL